MWTSVAICVSKMLASLGAFINRQCESMQQFVFLMFCHHWVHSQTNNMNQCSNLQFPTVFPSLGACISQPLKPIHQYMCSYSFIIIGCVHNWPTWTNLYFFTACYIHILKTLTLWPRVAGLMAAYAPSSRPWRPADRLPHVFVLKFYPGSSVYMSSSIRRLLAIMGCS